MEKLRWLLPDPIQISPELIAATGDVVIAEILYRRGYRTADSIRGFLHEQIYNPADFTGHPLVMPLVERIELAIMRGEKITIYGDYDVDGMTSSAVWMEALEQLGAQVSYHVPDRFEEGYGINVDVIKELALQGTRLIITCDCGIANRLEIKEALDLGMDVLVTDHHELPEVLPDVPIFNPKLLDSTHPAYWLPGVGASFIVAQQLLERAGRGEYSNRLLELLALGIIADVVPLIDDNRFYLRKGLPLLLASTRPGLRALYQFARITSYSTEEDVAFQVIPRLNAAGRLESARLGVDLLLARDADNAQALALRLDRLNEQRKIYCEKMLQEAENKLVDKDVLHAIALYHPEWPEGVVGIVAGRLAEQHEKPAFIMTQKGNGLVTGSARSIPGINVFEALTQCGDLLLKFGGHDGAAGFSLAPEHVDEFCKKVDEVIAHMQEHQTEAEPIRVDAVLSMHQVNQNFYQLLRTLAPFGPENLSPLFLIKDADIAQNQAMREGSPHRRLRLLNGKMLVEAVWWNSAHIEIGEKKCIVARLRLNVFRDIANIQLDIQDVIDDQEGFPSKVAADYGIVDCRGEAWDTIRAQYPLASVYPLGNDNTVTEHGIILLDIPGHLQELNDLLHRHEGSRIIIAWKPEPSDSEGHIDNTWHHLQGMLKYAIRMHGGWLTPGRIAWQLRITTEIVTIGLQALMEIGMLRVTEQRSGKIHIALEEGSFSNLRTSKGYRGFRAMLRELIAFRNYVRTLPIDELQCLLSKQERKAQ